MENVGKKRHNSQPLGGASKDARSEPEVQTDLLDEAVQTGDMLSYSQITAQGRGGLRTSNSFGLLAHPSSYPDRTMRSASICSRGSRGSRGTTTTRGATQSSFRQRMQHSDQSQPQRRTDLGDETRFITPPPDGQMRDEFVVECQTLNDVPFKGSVTFEEARVTIFHDILGFAINDLYSIRMRFSGCPILKFKLKQQTNLDDLASVEYFNLERKTSNPERIDYLQCKVLGIRKSNSVPHYDGSESDVRWVKIEGCDHQLTEEEIKEGLAPFGEILTPIREDIYEDSDSERDAVGNGTYSVKMKLSEPIPQFLPMHSKRIRIYHNGITKLCTNCFGRHTRRQCKNEKVAWIVYVRDFMKSYNDIEADYYGKWWDIVDVEYPGFFDEPELAEQSEHAERSDHTQPKTPRLLSSRDVTRFAESRGEPTKTSRDPRIQKQREQQSHNLQRSQQQPQQQQQQQSQPPTAAANNYDRRPDRQTEMTSLLAKGLTLSDAKKYIANMEEQFEIEKRMSRNQQTELQQQNNPRGNSRGRGLTRNNYY